MDEREDLISAIDEELDKCIKSLGMQLKDMRLGRSLQNMKN